MAGLTTCNVTCAGHRDQPRRGARELAARTAAGPRPAGRAAGVAARHADADGDDASVAAASVAAAAADAGQISRRRDDVETRQSHFAVRLRRLERRRTDRPSVDGRRLQPSQYVPQRRSKILLLSFCINK